MKQLILSHFLVLLFFSGCSSGTTISIENKSEKNIENLLLNYTGGQLKIPTIAPGQSEHHHIIPTGESSLIIDYQIEGDQKPQKDLDVYFEPGYQIAFKIIYDGSSMVIHK